MDALSAFLLASFIRLVIYESALPAAKDPVTLNTCRVPSPATGAAHSGLLPFSTTPLLALKDRQLTNGRF